MTDDEISEIFGLNANLDGWATIPHPSPKTEDRIETAFGARGARRDAYHAMQLALAKGLPPRPIRLADEMIAQIINDFREHMGPKLDPPKPPKRPEEMTPAERDVFIAAWRKTIIENEAILAQSHTETDRQTPRFLIARGHEAIADFEALNAAEKEKPE